MILVAVGLLFCMLLIDAKLGEEHISFTYGGGGYYLEYIDANFDYIKYTEGTVPPQYGNLMPGQGPFEELAPFPGFPWGCARRPNGKPGFWLCLFWS